MLKAAICGDIGGTNANLSIAEFANEIIIKEQSHESTAQYKDFSELVLRYIERVDFQVTTGCFAVAGPVINQRVEMTNANLVIDAQDIAKKTPLKDVLVINDFEAVGFATNVLTDSELKVLNKGKAEEKALRAAIGAGTGLGKSILVYNEKLDAYVPYPSEGGHVDFPIKDSVEMKIAHEIKNPTYEDFLSGRGLEFLYKFLQKNKYQNEPTTLSAKEISQNRKSSPCCKETFKLFVKFYARCAKNFALDLMAKGGIFLAGGITASNPDVFKKDFMEEFTRHPLPQFRKILESIPVTLITNYDISLKGAAFALLVKNKT
jgi:glucokinase